MKAIGDCSTEEWFGLILAIDIDPPVPYSRLNSKGTQMNKAIALILAVATIGVSACAPTRSEAQRTNAGALKTPTLIGTTEDGMPVYRYAVACEGEMYTHYIYRFGDKPTTTIDTAVQQGKTSRLEVTVLVDGKPTKTFELEVPKN